MLSEAQVDFLKRLWRLSDRGLVGVWKRALREPQPTPDTERLIQAGIVRLIDPPGLYHITPAGVDVMEAEGLL